MKGVFEIIEKDAAGRIGKIFTKHGVIETPYFFPVVNIHVPLIGPNDLKSLGYNAFITNAYTIWRDEKLHELALERGIHSLFGGWNGPIMTDSGAYQLSVYGDVEVSNLEIVKFQNDIGVDIGVILDVPLYRGSLEKRLAAIDETIRRAREAQNSGYVIEDSDVIWVGPLHGNPIPKLLEYSIKHMLEIPFKMYALGSLVAYMEEYQIYQLIRSAFITKKMFPSNYPIHLFGVGHPMVLSFFVLLGFDTFDSALYALAAKDNRYLTVHGTYFLRYMEYLPCNCPVCSKFTPKELLEMNELERQYYLAMHNLYAIQGELKRIKQAIWEGTLWELVARRASSHPELARAYNWLLSGKSEIFEFFETYEPVFKRKGCMITRSEEYRLPVVLRYKDRLFKRLYIWSNKLIISSSRGIHKLPSYLGAQVFIIDETFGLIPREIRNVYPLFQHMSYTSGIPNHIFEEIKSFLSNHLMDKFDEIYIFDPKKDIAMKIKDRIGVGEIYSGQDVGIVDITTVRTHITRALLKFQFDIDVRDIIGDVKFEFSKNTGMLRKIYAMDLSNYEAETIVRWELKRIVKEWQKRGLHLPTDPYDELFVSKGKMWLLASIVAENFKIVPHPLLAYRLWRKIKDSLNYCIIVNEEAEPFIRDGRSIFSKFVTYVYPEIRANDEVFVLNENRELIALAKAVLCAKEIQEFKRGVAAKNRCGFDISLS